MSDDCIHGPGVMACGHPDCVGVREFAAESVPVDDHWIAHVESCENCRNKYGDRPPLLGSA